MVGIRNRLGRGSCRNPLVRADLPRPGRAKRRRRRPAQEDRSVPAALPRVDFFHWVLFDLPASLREIKQGEFSGEVTPRGKAGPAAAHGARQEINDYGLVRRRQRHAWRLLRLRWPVPAVERRNRAPLPIFTLFALDVTALPIDGKASGSQLRAALAGHILDQASLTGLYTLNPAVRL